MSRVTVGEVQVPASAVPAFSERLWTPIWVYLLAFAFGAAMATAIALSGPASLELAVLSAVGLGLVFVLIFAFSTTLRRIHFDGIYLRLGFGEKIDLRWVTSIAVVDRE